MYKILGLVLLLLATPASSQEAYLSYGLYTGSVDYDAQGDPEVSMNNYAGKIAMHFTDGISVELRAGKTGSQTERIVAGAELELEADFYVSAYLRDTRSINDWVKWYALLGYSHAEFTGTIQVGDDSSEDEEQQSDVSYGLGLAVNFGENLSSHLEWKQIVKGDDFELAGFAIGLEFQY